MSSDKLIRLLHRWSRDPLAMTAGGLAMLAIVGVVWLGLIGPPVPMMAEGTAVVIPLSQGAEETAARTLPSESPLDTGSAAEPGASSPESGKTPPPAAPTSPPPPSPPEAATGAAVPEPSLVPPPLAQQAPAPTAPPADGEPSTSAVEDEAAFSPLPELLIPPGPSQDVVTAAERPRPAPPEAPAEKDSPARPAPETPENRSSPPQQTNAEEPESVPVQTSALPSAARGLSAPEPDPDLLELSRFGPLPRVSVSGRVPWRAYARPFDTNDKRPRISIVVSQLGFSSASTESAIWQLPAAVTLSFAPNARGLGNWIGLARAAGHEVLIELPMEPVDFPKIDPGPDTLLTSLTTEENRTRLRSLLGRVSGYVGVVNQMGSRFTTSEAHLRPVLKELRDRGLLFLDSRSSLHSIAARTASEMRLPRAVNNRFIDAEVSREAIDIRLAELERIARTSGYAVGIGQPHPITLERLRIWTRKLEQKGLVLAPISAMVNTQPD